jgi:hypothetical protein
MTLKAVSVTLLASSTVLSVLFPVAKHTVTEEKTTTSSAAQIRDPAEISA